MTSSFRKCYIAQKIVAVLCNEDGETVDNYEPCVSAHPFDKAWPPTGDNMFEDVDTTPRKCDESKKPRGKAAPLRTTRDDSEDGVSSADEVSAEEVNETVAEGARWLREQEQRESRRAEEGTRMRQAAARPVILSSSPGTETSTFIANSSSPLPMQSSPMAPSPLLARQGRKRKTADQDDSDRACRTAWEASESDAEGTQQVELDQIYPNDRTSCKESEGNSTANFRKAIWGAVQVCTSKIW